MPTSQPRVSTIGARIGRKTLRRSKSAINATIRKNDRIHSHVAEMVKRFRLKVPPPRFGWFICYLIARKAA